LRQKKRYYGRKTGGGRNGEEITQGN